MDTIFLVVLLIIGLYNILIGLWMEATGSRRFLSTLLFKFIPVVTGMFMVFYSVRGLEWLNG